MNKMEWLMLTFAVLASALLVQVFFSHATPTTLEVAGRLVWSG